jgi:hypothetical protein
MAQQLKGKKKHLTEADRKQTPKVRATPGTELSEEDLRQVVGGLIIQGAIQQGTGHDTTGQSY